MANSDGPLKIEDLERLCKEHEAESLVLEFKPCNELRPRGGVDAKGRPRSLDAVKTELSRDVSAFLNSAGGTIIYGIREYRSRSSSSSSRAKELDRKSAFQGKDPREDRVTEWIRAHVQPPPDVNVYSVLVDRDDPESSPWFLVVQIPQGLLAYMAKDDIFHKRVSNVRQHMAQYEVMDVMNRAQGATLELKRAPALRRAHDRFGISSRHSKSLWRSSNTTIVRRMRGLVEQHERIGSQTRVEPSALHP